MVEKREDIIILTVYLHHVKQDIVLRIYPAIKAPSVLKNEIVFIILILMIIIISLYILFKRTGFNLY